MNKIAQCLFVFALVGVLSSCSSWGKNRPNSLSVDQAELVSRDFVTAISRLRGFSPRETTVQFHAPKTVFGQKLHDAMRGQGFGLQILSDNEIGHNHVTYQSEQYEDSNGTTVAYQVSIGKVRLSREYEIRTGRVFPIAALSVLGATSSTDNNIDNSIFATVQDNEDWQSIGGEKSIIIVDEDRRQPTRIAQPAKRNLAELGESNYNSLFKLYAKHTEVILTFPNDSLRMGQENKNTTREMAKAFNPETDIFSVIGCSHGPTKLDNGNALLANGRASRVKEELIINNVPADNILDEGCWANGPFRNMPARGVVLTLRKRA